MVAAAAKRDTLEVWVPGVLAGEQVVSPRPLDLWIRMPSSPSFC